MCDIWSASLVSNESEGVCAADGDGELPTFEDSLLNRPDCSLECTCPTLNEMERCRSDLSGLLSFFCVRNREC